MYSHSQKSQRYLGGWDATERHVVDTVVDVVVVLKSCDFGFGLDEFLFG